MSEQRDFYDAANLIEDNKEAILHHLTNVQKLGDVLAGGMIRVFTRAFVTIANEMEYEKQE